MRSSDYIDPLRIERELDQLKNCDNKHRSEGHCADCGHAYDQLVREHLDCDWSDLARKIPRALGQSHKRTEWPDIYAGKPGKMKQYDGRPPKEAALIEGVYTGANQLHLFLHSSPCSREELIRAGTDLLISSAIFQLRTGAERKRDHVRTRVAELITKCETDWCVDRPRPWSK